MMIKKLATTLFVSALAAATLFAADGAHNQTLAPDNTVTVTVIGQGLAPENLQSKYQSIALAKRAAITDGYRLLAEKLYGVKVEGKDTIKNMVLQKSDVKSCVSALIQFANITETKCADNFCEVQMELTVAGRDWYPKLASAN